MSLAITVWTDKYRVGIAEIDAQHRALLDILGKLNHAERGEPGIWFAKEALWNVFEELNEYAAYHFLSEEKLMEKHLSVQHGTAKHIAQHRGYWVTISDYKRRHREGDPAVGGELLAFLNNWWIEHIQFVDRNMAIQLNEQGIR